jgi:hypothetical protein
MSGEAAAFTAAQQRHHHNMCVNGKKQRYIEVFQCSGEDMNHVLTGGTSVGAASVSSASLVTSVLSPSKTTNTTASASSGINGLLPPGMLTLPTSQAASPYGPGGPGSTGPAAGATHSGLDPNSAFLAAATAMQQQPNFFFIPRPQVPSAEHLQFLQPQQAQLGLRPNPALLYHPMQQAAVAAAQMQQQQLWQQQLLQSQLAAQRLLLGQAGGPQAQAGLIGPRLPGGQANTGKRSFDQAFNPVGGSANDAVAAAHAAAAAALAAEASKRPNFGTPTISAGPTTYR